MECAERTPPKPQYQSNEVKGDAKEKNVDDIDGNVEEQQQPHQTKTKFKVK